MRSRTCPSNCRLRVVLIYVRHGDDRGKDEYRHDRRLNDRGRKKAAKEAGRLIEKYGHPDVVYVSPFRRTIETLDCITVKFVRPVDVSRDPRIAQHLSAKQQREPRVSPQTLEAVAILEDRRAFERRVADHVAHARERSRAGATIWCITHQVVIEEVAGYFGVKISGDLDFLDHVVMVD
jgi:broad specificity phosphatase PhoE